MHRISLLKSRHVLIVVPYYCAETGQNVIIFIKSQGIKAVDVLKTLVVLANIAFHVSGRYIHSPLLVTG